jgi:hypothetical protein
MRNTPELLAALALWAASDPRQKIGNRTMILDVCGSDAATLWNYSSL